MSLSSRSSVFLHEKFDNEFKRYNENGELSKRSSTFSILNGKIIHNVGENELRIPIESIKKIIIGQKDMPWVKEPYPMISIVNKQNKVHRFQQTSHCHDSLHDFTKRVSEEMQRLNGRQFRKSKILRVDDSFTAESMNVDCVNDHNMESLQEQIVIYQQHLEKMHHLDRLCSEKIDELQRENKALRQHIMDCEIAKDEQIKTLQNEVKSQKHFEDEIECLTGSLMRIQRDFQLLNDKVIDLSEENADKDSKIKELYADKEKSANENKALQNELDQISNERIESDRIKKAYESKIKVLELEKNGIKTDQKRQTENARRENEMMNMLKMMEANNQNKVNYANIAYEEEIRQLKGENNAKEIKINQVTKAMEDIEEKYISLSSSVKDISMSHENGKSQLQRRLSQQNEISQRYQKLKHSQKRQLHQEKMDFLNQQYQDLQKQKSPKSQRENKRKSFVHGDMHTDESSACFMTKCDFSKHIPTDIVTIIEKHKKYHNQKLFVFDEFIQMGGQRILFKDVMEIIACSCAKHGSNWMMLTNKAAINIQSSSPESRRKIISLIQKNQDYGQICCIYQKMLLTK